MALLLRLAARRRGGPSVLRNEHGGGSEIATRQPLERHVRVFEGEAFDTSFDGDGSRQFEELARVPAREVRDAAERALPPEQLVRKFRDAVEMDSVDGDRAAPPQRPKRGHDDAPCGGERHRGVGRRGRDVVVAARPDGAEVECPALLVRRARRDEDLAAPVDATLPRRPSFLTQPLRSGREAP